MAWTEAKIKLGQEELDGMVNGDLVNCPMPEAGMDDVHKVSVDGKSYEIGAWQIDIRDNLLTIVLAMAGAKEKEVSDDQPAKGRSNT